jgi:hypothetical protein
MLQDPDNMGSTINDFYDAYVPDEVLGEGKKITPLSKVYIQHHVTYIETKVSVPYVRRLADFMSELQDQASKDNLCFNETCPDSFL